VKRNEGLRSLKVINHSITDSQNKQFKCITVTMADSVVFNMNDNAQPLNHN